MEPPAQGFRGPFWRVFPWDPAARPGEPYTPQYLLPAGAQTGGRFDLGDSPVLYLALDDPAHALAEVLQYLRGRLEVRDAHLRRRDRASGRYLQLALVETWLADGTYDALPDLGDPATLLRLGVRPDELASRDRAVTQRISRALAADHGVPGFRWWSAFSGDWHVAVLFMGRVDPLAVRYGKPAPLHLHHPVVNPAAAELKLRVGGREPLAGKAEAALAGPTAAS